MISKKHLQIASLPVLLILILVMWVPIVRAQASSIQENTTKLSEPAGSPVILSSDTLFFVRAGLGPYTSEQRAKSIIDRLKRLLKDPLFRIESISISDDELGTNVLAGEVIIATVTDADTKAVGLTRQELAKMYAQKIQKTMERVKTEHSLKTILLGLLFTLISIAVLVIIFKMLQRFFPKMISKLDSWRGTRIKTLKIQTLELLSSDQITDLLIGIVKIIRILAILLVLYFFIPLVLSFFPWTRGFGGVIIGYILSPLNVIWKSFVAYLPKAFFIVLIVIVTHYILKFIRLIFNEVARGKIVLPRFYQDWADPTYKIVRFLIIAFVIVVIFPYLPGSDAPAFKGVSIFLGVLFSLGSTSIVANIVAGVILTYMRPFQKGDRVKIADTVGDVEKKSLLGTHIRTIKNEDITIPNAMVLGSHIINFSSSNRDPV